ncbi:MAG TPA: ABC transporter permease [Candidatus Limnocylindrales bacterium]
MKGFGILLGKELREQTRTMRLLVVAVVFALFGILSPLTAKYLPDILKAVGGGQIPLGLIPPPRTSDAVDQFLKNIVQFGALAGILLAMGSVATEKDRGTAALVLTKPVSRAAFLAAKLVAIGLDLLVATVVAGALAWTYTLLLFGALPVAGFAAMVLAVWLVLLVFAALTFVGSTLARSAIAGAGLGVLFLVVSQVVAALPVVGKYTPQGLLGPARELALGGPPGDAFVPLVVTVVIVLGCGVVAWLVFRRQEL